MPPKKATPFIPLKDRPWNEEHPTRLLLYDALVLGEIPLSYTEMGPKAIYDKYSHMKEFEGIEYDKNFTTRLLSLRQIVARDKTRATQDRDALKIAMANHPVPEYNHRGEPQWNGSKAQKRLAELIDAGEYPTHSPSELWKSDGLFKDFGLNTFRWKIHQYIRTKKYLQSLKVAAAGKKPTPQHQQED